VARPVSMIQSVVLAAQLAAARATQAAIADRSAVGA